MQKLAGRSPFIQVEPLEVPPDSPPEKYVNTFTCEGIAGIDADENPITSEFHQVLMSLGRDYPLRERSLKWLTPVWHPDIEHEEPHSVSTAYAPPFRPARPLYDIVLALGEMVQYKLYNAKFAPLYPLDRVVAEWVRRVAEPRGLIGPDKPFDPRPLVEAVPLLEARRDDPPQPGKPRIKFGRRLE